MSKKKKAEFDYPATFDRLMEEQFGESFETTWNLFAGFCGGYVTTRANGKKLTKQMALFGRGISSGVSAMQRFMEYRP